MKKRIKTAIPLASVLLSLAVLPLTGQRVEAASDVREIRNVGQLAKELSKNWDETYAAETVIDTASGTVTQNGEKVTFADAFETEKGDTQPNLYSSYAVQSYFEDHPSEVSEIKGSQITVVNPYQARQIILRSHTLGDSYGASEMLHYADTETYYLRYKTEEETKDAYEKLHSRYGDDCVLDQVIQADDSLLTVSGGSVTWGTQYMGLNQLKSSQHIMSLNSHATVAVIDTGINRSHSLFAGRTISSASRNFVDNSADISDVSGHGSHVAGIIADATPAQVDLMILRVYDKNGNSLSSIVQAALLYAVEKGADVINISLGQTDYDASRQDWLSGGIDAAWEKGVPVICAAGNSRKNVSTCYPACNEKTIAVSAINRNGQFAASFNQTEGSNYGNGIDFAAPGVAIDSASNRNNYELDTKSGTSMAAPYVSAAAAYIKLALPQSSVTQVENILRSYARDYGAPGKDPYYGYGVIGLENLQIGLTGNAILSLQQSAMVYNGTPCAPGITLSGIPSAQYSVTYTNNDGPGTGMVSVSGRGLYSGTLTASFRIDMQTPVLTGVENTAKGIMVSWNDVPGAQNYSIYRKKNKGAWSQVKTVSENILSWTDTKLSADTSVYTYKVKAIAGSISTAYSAEASTARVKAASLGSVVCATKGITLKWKKVSGVKGYYIYRRTDGQSEWKYLKKIGSARTTRYTDTKAVQGARCYYQVRPYRVIAGKTYVGGAANTKSVVYLKKMATPSARARSGRRLQVFWKASPKANGYEIRYATNRKMKAARTLHITSPDELSCTISGLKKNKTYYVQVRAVRQAEGMLGYSGWSGIRSVRIRK